MDTLSFLIKPSSYSCNIDCDYCFYQRVEDIYGKKTSMNKSTLDVLMSKALSANARYTSFCWQGGEPLLLGLDFFNDIITIQEKYKEPNQVIENTIQTNGILIDDNWCEFFRNNNILAGISLDGPEDIHNQYRKHNNGKGTFNSVMGSIDMMKKNYVKFNILTLLTKANVNEPEKVYSFFRENNFNFLQFINCFDYQGDADKITEYSITGEEASDFYCKLFDLWMEDGFPNVSIRLFDEILSFLIDNVNICCYSMESCNSYIVVEHNGDCYPCDFFVYPEWKLGNIAEDDLSAILDNPLRTKFAAIKSQVHDDCKQCSHIQFCHGDCIKFRGNMNGNYKQKSEYCVLWKNLFSRIEPHLDSIKEKIFEIREERDLKIKTGVSRNDPCLCGSGMKYKHCCGWEK